MDSYFHHSCSHSSQAASLSKLPRQLCYLNYMPPPELPGPLLELAHPMHPTPSARLQRHALTRAPPPLPYLPHLQHTVKHSRLGWEGLENAARAAACMIPSCHTQTNSCLLPIFLQSHTNKGSTSCLLPFPWVGCCHEVHSYRCVWSEEKDQHCYWVGRRERGGLQRGSDVNFES